jgi:hypothetical protein
MPEGWCMLRLTQASMSGSNVPQFKVLVIGDTATFREPTRTAWHSAGIVLEGPFSAATVDMSQVREWAGVLVDIGVLDESLMTTLETFDDLKVPYVFVVTGEAPAAGPQPYVLGPRSPDIQLLLNALLDEGRLRPGNALQPLS